MKNTMKVFLALVIFCSVGLADGEQPGGGRASAQQSQTVKFEMTDIVLATIKQIIGMRF